MERMTLESIVSKIVQKIGQPKALAYIKENFGVATFARLDRKALEQFIEHFKEYA